MSLALQVKGDYDYKIKENPKRKFPVITEYRKRRPIFKNINVSN